MEAEADPTLKLSRRGEAGRTDSVAERTVRFPGGIGHGKTQFRVAGHIPDLDAERNHPFGTRAYGYFNGRRGNHAQGLVRRQRQRKGSRLSRIVGDGKRGLELVARRSQNRKLRRQNHRAAHRGVGFGAAAVSGDAATAMMRTRPL